MPLAVYLCMLSVNSKLSKTFFKPRHVLDNAPSMFSSFSFLAGHSQANAENAKDIVFMVSSMINKPNWEKNSLLKSLVSHMTPQIAHKVVELNSKNTNVGVRFFKWICKQSTYCYSLDSRIHLLNLIVSSGLFGVAHKAIIELIKESRGVEDDILKLMDALDGLRKTGFMLNYPCYSSLMMGLAKANLGFATFLVYNRMVADGFAAGGIDYRTIINALCKNGFLPASEMVLCRSLKLGFDLDTHVCTSFVLGYCREHLLNDAFWVFEVMSRIDGCQPNSVTYSTLIHGLCQVDRMEEAFGLKEEMAEKGCLPSTRTYTVLIKAVCDAGLIEKALSLLDEMVGKGCKPNVHTYTVLIDGLCRKEKIEEANGMFRRMLQDGMSPTIITFNTLINGYCKEGRIVKSFEMLSLMERTNCQPNIRTYNELIEGLCRVGKSYKAIFLLRKMVDNGLVPDRVTYNLLVEGFCKEGKLDVAFKILKSMKLFGLQPDGLTFTSIIDGFSKRGNPELANGLLGLMLKDGVWPDEIAFTALMDGYYKVGKTVDALMLFGWMMELTHFTSAHAFNLYLDILCKQNRLKEEYAMFGKIIKYGLLPSVVTYTILINGLCRAGEITNSLHVLKLMKQAGCAPNVYTYTVIIDGLCQNGRIEEAEELLFGMSDLGVPPNHVTYTVLVKAHAIAGNLDRALEIVCFMVKNGCQPSNRTYSVLLAGFTMSKKSIGAQNFNSTELLDCISLQSEGNDDAHIPNNFLQSVDVELALELADKIERCGGSTTEFYNILAKSLCKEDRVAEVDDLIVGKVNDGLFLDKAIYYFIQWHCKKQNYDYCQEYLKMILNNGCIPSFDTFFLVIQGLHHEGKSQQARTLVSDMLRHCGVQDGTAVSPHIDFLFEGDVPEYYHELLKLIEKIHYQEKPVF